MSAVDKVNRNTPLHCAVLAGNVDAAHILLEAGASVDAENINVSTETIDSLQKTIVQHLLRNLHVSELNHQRKSGWKVER